MDDAMTAFLAWLAPIMSSLIIAAGQLKLNSQFREADNKRDQARAATDAKCKEESEWRELIVSRLDEQDEKIGMLITSQASDTRADIVHKCHRYLDDIGKASFEEKQALSAQHKDYKGYCKANGIDNNFIDEMVARVMSLPER